MAWSPPVTARRRSTPAPREAHPPHHQQQRETPNDRRHPDRRPGQGLRQGAGPERPRPRRRTRRSEEHTSELQSRFDLVCRLLLEKKKKKKHPKEQGILVKAIDLPRSPGVEYDPTSKTKKTITTICDKKTHRHKLGKKSRYVNSGI